jgi:hypothetical protein
MTVSEVMVHFRTAGNLKALAPFFQGIGTRLLCVSVRDWFFYSFLSVTAIAG